jgi:enoyl-CoA hydratase/carnithine racemase
MFDLSTDGGVATLTLNRPEARNAVPSCSWAKLADAAEAGAADARLLVLRGAGTAFCAGADLSGFPTMRHDAEARAEFRLAMRGCFARIAALAVPTIGFIDGPCFGAGVALAMACDLRIVGEGARFAITPAKFGISYPQDDIARLTGLVGRSQAARMLLTGLPIDGKEALRIGLADMDGGEAAVDAVVAAILANSTSSIATLRRGIALAARGIASDAEQDRRFDDALGSDELFERLARR